MINNLPEHFKLNHKYGQLLNTDRKFRPTDQLTNMTLTANRESANVIASPMKFNSDVNPKDLTREQAQATTPFRSEPNLIDKSNNFYFTDSKMQSQFKYDYHHWGANSKVLKNLSKREETPEILRLFEILKKITKPRSLQFKIDSSLNKNVWIPRRPDKRGSE